ncbi:DUF2167 domain-containing protein [Paenibacillus sp. HWE-109]|uniref:DUF2167 domain-containing protein n=1 Tax=Paenibacillus sp. HWE-109 TaxID=1306526 RepID=UPI001EDED21D|nr:DUF2167 domain-containing protein [Paenibacillus sp. HWE-109]UKS26828.1 DUF2167 domain-containing protein [Paenibacillus sp. HWE-109]
MLKRIGWMALILCMVAGSSASAEESTSKYTWIEGGKIVDLGPIAAIDLGPEFVFLDAENTKKMSKENHESVTGNEMGSIFPKNADQTWTVILEYEKSGHIKDDEKTKIDAKDLLNSYKKGTEAANKERQEGQRIHVKGWDIEPFYDEKTHGLTWSLLAEDDNKATFLNYNTRILTREGNISVILVSDPAHREADKKVLAEKLLPKLTMKPGEKYEDFNPAKDKMSEYGLSALILGGAGLAVAKKVGFIALILVFLKKFAVLIVIALGAVWTFIKKRFQRRDMNG